MVRSYNGIQDHELFIYHFMSQNNHEVKQRFGIDSQALLNLRHMHIYVEPSIFMFFLLIAMANRVLNEIKFFWTILKEDHTRIIPVIFGHVEKDQILFKEVCMNGWTVTDHNCSPRFELKKIWVSWNNILYFHILFNIGVIYSKNRLV